MGLLSLVKAEAMLRLWWLKNNRIMLVMEFVWPYSMIVILLVMGTAYGSIDQFASTLGVVDPLLYIFASSTVAFASVSIVDASASVAQWHRWLGTLPYIMSAPYRLVTYTIISGLATSMLTIATQVAAILPAIVYLSGAAGASRFGLVVLFLFLGMVPLVAIGAMAATASLLVREESNVMAFLNPLLVMLSGVFYPLEILPQLMEEMARLIPTSHVVEAAKIAATYTEGPGRLLLATAYVISLMAVLYNIAGGLSSEYIERLLRRRGAAD